MKELEVSQITNAVAALIHHCLCNVDQNTCALLKDAAQIETAPLCKWAIDEILTNNLLAAQQKTPACQDCGQAVLFVSFGQELAVTGGTLSDALNRGVLEGYREARKSVCDPLTRQNTQTNTPAVIHYDIAAGDSLEIAYLAKGAGSENMSRLYMLTPSKGEDGIIHCVTEAVRDAGANPCPPIVLGIGIGGTAELCAILSKRALLRNTGEPSTFPHIQQLEQRILNAVNETGIGAQGFGGRITALAAAIETAPTHIGMLPVSVNIQCHCVRHGKVTL